MTPRLYCARPHIKTVDFDGVFVVARESGIDAGTTEGVVHFSFGEAVPKDSFDRYTLQCLYGLPEPHAIETLAYAETIPEVHAAMVARGTPMTQVEVEEPTAIAPPVEEQPKPSEPSRKILDMLESLTRRELIQLCEKHGLKAYGNKADLLNSLVSVLA